MLDGILSKAKKREKLTKDDAISLLSIENNSYEFYNLLATANDLSRNDYKNKGYIFTQIGINSDPCSGNCTFCSLASTNYSVEKQAAKTLDEIALMAKQLNFENIEALFLMTTADYSQTKFLDIGKEVRSIIPSNIIMVANVGDFDNVYAEKLKEVGFGAAYHIVRLREGIDTAITAERRIQTLDAIKSAGLDLYYCVEPIGKEHTYEEIAEEMIRARNYSVDVMAVMGRVGVKNTKFEEEEALTELELTKIAAVTRLVTNPKKSMNIHEPKAMALLAGINQLYAEIGFNPRDTKIDTENGRGFTIDRVAKMLRDAEYSI